jgi:hypothetical protein
VKHTVLMHVKAPAITMRQIAAANPGSVWHSLVTRADWLTGLDISVQAKRLTLLHGNAFVRSVNDILARGKRVIHAPRRPCTN